jgi:hypothetical protein
VFLTLPVPCSQPQVPRTLPQGPKPGPKLHEVVLRGAAEEGGGGAAAGEAMLARSDVCSRMIGMLLLKLFKRGQDSGWRVDAETYALLKLGVGARLGVQTQSTTDSLRFICGSYADLREDPR